MTLRVTQFLNRSTTQIQVEFSSEMNPDIGVANIFVKSTLENIPDITVKAVSVSGAVLSIDISPQIPIVLYYVEFISTSTQGFQDIDGDRLQDDNNTSRIYFVGLEKPNEIRDSIFQNLSPVFNTEDPTYARDHVSNVADRLLKAKHDLRETANSNYISESVVDEQLTRGFGPTDRLLNEGAYEITRVATTATGASAIRQINFNSARGTALLGASYSNVNTAILYFPSSPFSLRTVSIIREVVSNAEIVENKFEEAVVTLSKKNVIQIHSVVLNKSDNTSIIYDIPAFGYSLLSNRYDELNAGILPTLSSSQFKISDAAILSGDFEVPVGLDELIVSYSYIDNGINVDQNTVAITQVKHKIRESTGAYLNTFYLENFPIVSSSDGDITLGGVTFADPQPSSGTPFVTTHDAFSTEIVYSESRLPANVGEYAVNYSSGQVFVYGAVTANGTGSHAPVATYYYRKSFTSGIDYSVDLDTDEIAAYSSRNLIGEEVKLTFEYERVLADGVDYISEVHTEVIDEYVGNRLISGNQIITSNYPVTNVFKILNETTGETYGTSRFDEYSIYLTGRNLPRVESITNEIVEFERAPFELLYVGETIETSLSSKLVKFNLMNAGVLALNGAGLGYNLNSSVVFSDQDIFANEMFFDDENQTLQYNLNKLSSVGYFVINYRDGEVYLRTELDTYEYGQISYTYDSILTQRPNILSATDIKYKPTTNSDTVSTVEIDSFTSERILVGNMPPIGERFLHRDIGTPIIVGAKQQGVAGQRTRGSSIFVALDAVFEAGNADGNHVIRFTDDFDRAVVEVISSTTVRLDSNLTDNDKSVAWCLIDFSLADGYTAVTTYDILNIRGIYTVSELQTLPADQVTNLYDATVDTISGNLITFNNLAVGNVAAGDALIIDYDFGNAYVDYTYVADNIRVSYEYGDNSINHSISDALVAGQEYYVSYKYGALRESLLTNFGSLTQVEELTNFALNFNRETYRDAVSGAISSFLHGPTVSSVSNIVSSITKVTPIITEFSFNEWTLGRDNLHLQNATTTGTIEYVNGHFNKAIEIKDDATLSLPAESYISLREGSFTAWVSPNWKGIDNDATITLNIGQDGYYPDGTTGGYADGYRLDFSDIYIGSTGYNPSTMPFDLNRVWTEPAVVTGRPVNFGDEPGYFVWYDEDESMWKIRWVAQVSDGYTFNGQITTSGEIHRVEDGYDGYSFVNEVSDYITSTRDYINFETAIDGYEPYDGYVSADGYLFDDGIDFTSDNKHFIMDTGENATRNRLSLYKDGSGYLNFRAYDRFGLMYNLSGDISSWVAGEDKNISAAWRFNSAEGIDEMHLFIEGQEVANNFKFGGRPSAAAPSLYRTEAIEVISAGLPKNIIGNYDGVSIASSTTFSSAAGDFVANGIIIGDTLSILDSTADGLGGPYTITAVGASSLILSSPLTLSLSNISYSVNRAQLATDTNIDTERIAVYATDALGVRRELYGILAEEPDYNIYVDGTSRYIYVNKGCNAGDIIDVVTLGLNCGRVRETVFEYNNDNILKTNLPPPISLDYVSIYKYIFRKSLIVDDGYATLGDGTFTATGNTIDGYFTNVSQPSNSIDGKILKFILSGTSNIDFSGINQVVIEGTSSEAVTSETVSFSDYISEVTINHFTSILSIDMQFTAYNGAVYLGSIEIIELSPLTASENGGNYAQILKYDNGRFRLYEFGSGGVDFNIGSAYYLIDYQVNLNIRLDEKGLLFIGSDINGENQFNGALSEISIFNEMMTDVRIGETPSTARTITSLYNLTEPATVDSQTLLLMHMNDSIDNVNKVYKIHSEEYSTSAQSVNSNFGDCAYFSTNKPYVIDNAASVIYNNEGSVEFWVSPLIDTLNDDDHARYYIDMSAITSEITTSISAKTIILLRRASSIASVRLVSDEGDGVNYFEGGKLGIDGLTITLGTNLPGQSTRVVVRCVPIDLSGDRLSIYKDGYGSFNFEISASGTVFQISYPIIWERNSWHRIFASWDLNNLDNRDRIRLFIDGAESGTLLYGSAGAIYGIGLVYGSATIGSGSNFLTTNIDFTDSFADIYVGNSADRLNKSMAKIDNLRFSNIAREPATIAGRSIDLNYNANLETVLPVIDDNFTTAIFDFDAESVETKQLSNLLSESTPLFLFDVDVADSFRKINGDQTIETLIENLINRLKPAHTNAYISFST